MILSRIISTWFFIGEIKKAPGTWGSIGALPICYFLYSIFLKIDDLYEKFYISSLIFICIIIFLFIIGIFAIKKYNQTTKIVDHKSIVIDEVIGQTIAFFFIMQSCIICDLGFFNKICIRDDSSRNLSQDISCNKSHNIINNKSHNKNEVEDNVIQNYAADLINKNEDGVGIVKKNPEVGGVKEDENIKNAKNKLITENFDIDILNIIKIKKQNFLFIFIFSFALFRFFDITKIMGIRFIESKFCNPFGVIFDDILAGLIAGIFGIVLYFMLYI